VWLEEMTWMNVRDAMKAGKTRYRTRGNRVEQLATSCPARRIPLSDEGRDDDHMRRRLQAQRTRQPAGTTFNQAVGRKTAIMTAIF
jgi:hypothetical protein